VPDELQEMLLREVRQLRFRTSVIYFPVLLLIFSALAAGVAFLKGHALVEILRRLLGNALSEQSFWLIFAGVAVVFVASGLVFFLRQMYRECGIERHLFCASCTAVDSDDEGSCPVCRRELSQEAGFFSTAYSDEKKLLDRYGLVPYVES
jgi:hypothetical protein